MLTNVAIVGNETDKLSHHIRVYDEAFTSEQCEAIIKSYEDSDEKMQGPVWGEDGKPILTTTTKNVMQAKVEYESEADNIISTAVGEVLAEYLTHFEFYPANALTDEGYSIKKYEPDTDYYHWHVDGGSEGTRSRVLTVVFYLNDVEEGGETEFFGMGIAVNPKQGRCVVFPSNFMFPHRACIPLSGPKYMVNTFIHQT